MINSNSTMEKWRVDTLKWLQGSIPDSQIPDYLKTPVRGIKNEDESNIRTK